MNLEEELKKLGYIKYNTKVKPSINTEPRELITRMYKEKGEYKFEYYIKNENK